MINKISDPKIDWIVKKIVCDQSLLDLKPILAGGSMLSAYKAYRFYDTKERWSILERAWQVDPKSFYEKIDKFGDIDAWFSADRFDELSFLGDFGYEKSLPKPFEGRYNLARKSRWANSFKGNLTYRSNSNLCPFIFQAIKTPISSVGDMFHTFDFINCCVAYHDGDLYYHRDIDSSFESFELRLNNSTNYTSESIPQRVYAGLRAFKYAKRYMLDFSAELSENIFKIYLDLEKFSFQTCGSKIPLDNDVYGTTMVSKGDINDMVRSFELNFSNFTKMKSFKPEYAFFLVDRRNLPGLKEYIDGAPFTNEPIYINLPF